MIKYDLLKKKWVILVAYDTWRACFPERNNYVLFFKTLAGAKRNFIKNGFKKMIQDTMIKGELI
jgi:hypothetical protein